jgi:DNA-directed RNA polymerase subunit RPC12/RpoP
MNSFTDYYSVLGVPVDASPKEIKAAFKQLALRYHPDIYKGEDAHERMRLLLRAYQTLNDPVERKKYDARRSEHSLGSQSARGTSAQRVVARSTTGGRSPSEVTPSARRDRKRYYDFPDFREGQPLRIDLVDIVYTLPATKAASLVQQGLLRGVAPETAPYSYYCHRCHHRWDGEPSRRWVESREDLPEHCPKCRALDWTDYLLLRCIHCGAVFESEQIRYEVGIYTYKWGFWPIKNLSDLGPLCQPYELFPLCPYCGSARWCPAEDARVQHLRTRAAQRAALLRLAVIGAIAALLIIAGFVALNTLVLR